MMIKASGNRGLFYTHQSFFFVLALLLLLAGGFLVYRERNQTFPMLLPGLYYGTITGVGEADAPLILNVDSDSKTVRLLALTGHNGEIVASLTPVQEGSPEAYPLVLKISEKDLRLIGAPRATGSYEGVVRNSVTAVVGRWEVTRFSGQYGEILMRSQQWLSIASQLESTRRAVDSASEDLRSAEEEIARLETLAQDTPHLLENARHTEDAERVKIAALVHTIAEAERGVEALRKQLSLTRHLSPAGKMVQLSKECFRLEEPFFFKNLMPYAAEKGEPDV